MVKRTDDTMFNRLQSQLDFEQAVAASYQSLRFTTKQIAQTYGISPRSVQRIASKWGVVRTQAEGNRTAAPLQPKHRMRGGVKRVAKGRSKDNALRTMRHLVLQVLEAQGRDFSKCELCGAPLNNDFHLHHTKYEGATIKDLQIVCMPCNLRAENRFLA